MGDEADAAEAQWYADGCPDHYDEYDQPCRCEHDQEWHDAKIGLDMAAEAEEQVIEGEIVDEEEGKEAGTAPTRLAMNSLGGLKIKKPQDSMPFLNLMIYGDSGAGKTLLAGTAAYVEELAPVLFVDVEGGTLTLSHFDDSADIDVVRIEKWTDLQKVYDELYAGKHPYKTIVLDSLTEMQKLHMSSTLGAGSKIDAVGNVAEFKDWNINTESMRRLVRAFRDLKMNTIFTCLAMDQQDPRRENVFIKKPHLTKKLAGEIPAFFDVLFYLYVKEQKAGPNLRFVQTDKSDRVVAKCRVQGVPEFIENPTMDNLYDLLIRNPHKPVQGEIQVVQNAKSGGGLQRRSK